MEPTRTFSPRAAAVLAIAAVAVALALVVSTYSVLTQTWDEPAHVGAGLEWWTRGTFTLEPLTPPLARAAVALGPYLAGARDHGRGMWTEGNAAFHGPGGYSHNLALARLGTLPFFVLACAIVWAWGRRLGGPAGACLAVFLLTTLPPILANAGVAATDMAVAATFAAAAYAWMRWLERPSRGRAVLAGVASGLAAIAKFSTIPFLALAVLGMVAVRALERPGTAPRPRGSRAGGLVLILVAAFLTTWAGYRFAVGRLTEPGRTYPGIERRFGTHGLAHDAAHALVDASAWPAPSLWMGLRRVPHRNDAGHRASLFGRVRTGGNWLFFLVGLAVKTPLPFLALVFVGLLALARGPTRVPRWQRLAPLVAALAVLVVAMAGRVNVGTRLALAVYPPLAVVAAIGGLALARSRPGAVALAGLLGWQAIGTWRNHPDQLTYANALAGGHLERVLVSDDVDWGQDLGRLADTLRVRHIDRVALAYNAPADLERAGLPAWHRLEPHRREAGWIAASVWAIEMGDIRTKQPPFDDYRWLREFKPVARVGHTIFLYDIPPGAVAPTTR